MLEELLALGHTRRRVRRLADQHQRGRPVRQRLRRGRTRTRRSRRCWTAAGRSRSASSSPARSCCTWPRSSARFLPTDAGQRAPNACRGCSGRWAARPISAAASAISMPMRRSRSSIAIDRFAMEVKRQLDVLDRRLAESAYLAGDDYTHRRHRGLALVRRAGQGPGLRRRRVPAGAGLQTRAALDRCDRAASGGASAAAWSTAAAGEPASQLHERHDAGDFDTRTPDKLGTVG